MGFLKTLESKHKEDIKKNDSNLHELKEETTDTLNSAMNKHQEAFEILLGLEHLMSQSQRTI